MNFLLIWCLSVLSASALHGVGKYLYLQNECIDESVRCLALPNHHFQYYYLEQLIDDLRKEGAEFDDLLVTTLPQGYRGVQVLKDFKEGETALTIPLDLAITSHMGKARPMGQAMSKILDKMSDHVFDNYLVLYLLEFAIEKPADHTIHRAFLNLLPDGLEFMSSLPVTWSSTEAQELLGETTYAYFIQQKQKEIFSSDYNIFKEHIPGFSQFTYEQYLWARLIVLSRGFEWDNEDDPGLTFVPFTEMMNHANKKSYWSEGRAMDWVFNHTSHSYILTVERDVAAGDEATITYMSVCNSKFLLYYGFTLEENFDFNAVEVQIPIEDAREPQFGAYTSRLFTLVIHVYEEETYALFSYLRYMMDPSKEPITDPSYDFGKDEIGHSTIELEIAVLERIQTICKTALSEYTTTFEQDMEMLNDTKAFPYGSKQRNARNILRGEKQIWNYYTIFTTTMIDWLNKDRNTVIDEIQKRYQHEAKENPSDEHRYAQDIILDLL